MSNERSALDVQEGGDHYKKRAIQPVQYIHANGIGFFEGSVIKYVTRWRDKGGIKDLEKARHFIDLLIELENKANGAKVPVVEPAPAPKPLPAVSTPRNYKTGRDFLLKTGDYYLRMTGGGTGCVRVKDPAKATASNTNTVDADHLAAEFSKTLDVLVEVYLL